MQTQFRTFFPKAPKTVISMLLEWTITSESWVLFYTSWQLNYVDNVPRHLYHIKN